MKTSLFLGVPLSYEERQAFFSLDPQRRSYFVSEDKSDTLLTIKIFENTTYLGKFFDTFPLIPEDLLLSESHIRSLIQKILPSSFPLTLHSAILFPLIK